MQSLSLSLSLSLSSLSLSLPLSPSLSLSQAPRFELRENVQGNQPHLFFDSSNNESNVFTGTFTFPNASQQVCRVFTAYVRVSLCYCSNQNNVWTGPGYDQSKPELAL